MATSGSGRYIVIPIWILAAWTFLSLAGQWIAINSQDAEFTQYAQHILRSARATQAPISEVRKLLTARAKELSIPLEQTRLSVQHEGAFLRTAFDYELPFTAPLIHRVVYRLQFHHDLTEK